MGVEYMHGVFVADTTWRPTWDHVEKVHAVLTTWGFQRDKEAYFELDESSASPIDAKAARKMPPNFFVSYDTLEGSRAAAIMGPSRSPDPHRYIMGTQLHLGVDYKVIAHVEGFEVEVTTPPRNKRVPVEPLDFHDTYPATVVVYPATWETSRPKTDGPKKFDHVWRSALLLDCHKDIPNFAHDAKPLPARDFVQALEKAFGTKLVEYGWLY